MYTFGTFLFLALVKLIRVLSKKLRQSSRVHLGVRMPSSSHKFVATATDECF